MKTFIYISDARKLYANSFIGTDFTGHLSEMQYRAIQPIQKIIKLGLHIQVFLSDKTDQRQIIK